MVKSLLVLLISFGLSAEWGTSFSVRSANDDTKPLDYEFSIKLNDTNGKVRYVLKRDWERELGVEYIDDVVNFQHQAIGHFYYGIDYVNKESKDISYTTYNIGATIDWFKVGASFKVVDGEVSPLLNLAVSTKLKEDDLEYILGVSAKTDISENHIFNIKSEVKKWLTERINVFALYKHEYYNKQEDFQFKVGLGVKL
jgi:hypothetical protein